MAYFFSKLALGQVVPYEQWGHMTPMDTMASKAEAFHGLALDEPPPPPQVSAFR